MSDRTEREIVEEMVRHAAALVARSEELRLLYFGIREIVPPTTSGVYVVLAGAFIKIGRASNIADRIRSLQTSQPLKLKLIAIASTNPLDEKRFHAQLSRSRARARSEWFQLDAQTLQFLTDLNEAAA